MMATSPDELRQCPYCAEKIQKAALVCKHCRSKLTERSESSTAEPPGTRELATSLTHGFGRIAAIVVGAAVVAFVGFKVFISGTEFQRMNPTVVEMQQQAANDGSSKVPSLAGTWQLAFQSATEQQVHLEQMQIKQNGSTIQGQGQDRGPDQAPFVLTGAFNPPKIMFNKQYVVDGQPEGKPVTFMGQVTFSKNEAPFMEGVFVEVVKKGVSTQMHFEEVRGKWQAEMESASTSGSPAGRKEEKTDENSEVRDSQK